MGDNDAEAIKTAMKMSPNTSNETEQYSNDTSSTGNNATEQSKDVTDAAKESSSSTGGAAEGV